MFERRFLLSVEMIGTTILQRKKVTLILILQLAHIEFQGLI